MPANPPLRPGRPSEGELQSLQIIAGVEIHMIRFDSDASMTTACLVGYDAEVSVVIPAYNAARFLGHTISSIQAQTLSNWELLIVDDGSTDETYELARAYSSEDARIRVIRQENKGVSKARNHGWSVSTPSTPFILFLDADDVLHPPALEHMVDALREAPSTVALAGLSRFIDKDGTLIQSGQAEAWGRRRRTISGLLSRPCGPGDGISLETLAHWNSIFTPGQVMIQRTALSSIKGFDEALGPAADYDLWIRLALHGDFAFLNEVVLDYRRHDNAMSGNARAESRDAARVRQKVLLTLPLKGHQARNFVIARLYGSTSLRAGWIMQSLRQHRIGQAAKHFLRMNLENLRLCMLVARRVLRAIHS
jgi:glycosyltransferase involved in cell wall biosynthesis